MAVMGISKKDKKEMSNVNMKLEKLLIDEFDELSKSYNMSRTECVRQLMRNFIKSNEEAGNEICNHR